MVKSVTVDVLWGDEIAHPAGFRFVGYFYELACNFDYFCGIDVIVFVQELDLIRMKHRSKRPKSALPRPKSELLFIVRIQG